MKQVSSTVQIVFHYTRIFSIPSIRISNGVWFPRLYQEDGKQLDLAMAADTVPVEEIVIFSRPMKLLMSILRCK